MIEEEVALLERRLTARQLVSRPTLFDLMLDDIDATQQTTPMEWEGIKQLKNDILRRGIMADCGMAEKFRNAALAEKEKYFVKRNVDESITNWQMAVINTIERRRLHMIERAAYITQFKLSTDFKND